MIIYPDIEILDGRCVMLNRGLADDPVVYPQSPAEAAREFVSEGATWLHICDLDSVFQGGRHNSDQIVDIIQEVDVPVQVAGGIRTMQSVEWWMDHGASRVVIGTAAVTDRTFLRDVCARYPSNVVVSVDSRQGMAVIDGWKTTTSYTAMDLCKDFEQNGVAALIYTDIDRYDKLPESSLASTTDIASSLTIPVICTGIVDTLDDVAILHYLPNVAGTIIGRALFNKVFRLSEALDVTRQPVQNPPLDKAI